MEQQNRTGHDTTRHDTTRAGQGRAGQGAARHDMAGQDRTEMNHLSIERANCSESCFLVALYAFKTSVDL